MREIQRNILATVTIFLMASTGFAATKSAPIDATVSTVKWTGKKVAGPHNGTVNVKSGTVTLDNGKIQSGEVVIDMTTISNADVTDAGYNKKLVDHLKSDDFFAVEKNPTAVFKIKKAALVKGNEYKLTGDITIRGKTKEITVPATVKEEKGTWTATSKFKINRMDFDVKYNSAKSSDPGAIKALGDKLIYDDIELDLTLKTKI